MQTVEELRRRGINLDNLNNPTPTEVSALLAETERLNRLHPRKPRKAKPTMTTPNTNLYRQEYQRHQHIHSQLGITEAEYIDQRMIEDGHKEEPNLWPEDSRAETTDSKEFATSNAPGLIDPNDPAWN